MTNFYYLFR